MDSGESLYTSQDNCTQKAVASTGKTNNSNVFRQWKVSNGKDLADFNNDEADEEQLHFSVRQG